MPSIQRFELSPNDTIKLLTREPLLIVRLTILKPGLPNTMRPVRKKSYQKHTFALCIPLKLDGDGLDTLKMEQLSWSCLLARASWRHLKILPHTPIWESLAKLNLHWSIASYNQMISSEMDHALHSLLDVLIKHDFILQITTLKPTYGSNIVYGHVLQI
jgi:hypothetical protein